LATSSCCTSRLHVTNSTRRPPRTGVADAVGRPAVEPGIEFLAAAADGIDGEAGEEGEQGVAAGADLLGLQGSEPAALLLVEAAHDEVEVGMPLPVGMIPAALTAGALALMNRGVRHDKTSTTGKRNRRRILYGNPWKSFLDAP
jgi:hypothetical protein